MKVSIGVVALNEEKTLPSLFEDFKMNHLLNIQGGVLGSLCSQQISDFFKKRRAIKKSLK